MLLLDIKELETLSPVFRGKLGNRFGKFLMDILSVSRLNSIHDSIDFDGPDAAKAIIDKAGASYSVANLQRLKDISQTPFITISNHPYGALDGIILIDLIGHLFPDYKVMVNTILSRVTVLGPNFITVVPTSDHKTAPTAQSLKGTRETLEHIRSGHPMGFFPSGAVSDLIPSEGVVRDRPWQEPILRLIRKAKVPIVPVRFFDGNSNLFYQLGRIDWRVRLFKLPSELVNKGKQANRVGIGEVISIEKQQECPDLESFGKMLRDSIYDMAVPEQFIPRDQLVL